MVARTLYLPTSPADSLKHITGIQRSQDAVEYAVELLRDSDRSDLSDYVLKDSNSAVSWTCTSSVPASISLTLDSALALQWGSERVAASQLVRSAQWNAQSGLDPSAWVRFPLAHFVLTSPGIEDLDHADVRPVTGYDPNYLLQSDLSSALNFDFGTTYIAAVKAVFVAAGIIPSSAALSLVCDYPGDWPAKTLPNPMPFPLDGGASYLDVVNQLLKASGCSGLFTSSTGRWVVQNATTYNTSPLLWRWAASSGPGVSEDDLNLKVVVMGGSGYDGDVYNQPNQWVFVQQGLSFQPIEGSGLYTVNNTSVPPSDQNSVGRVLRKTVFLQASGQADLKKQGDKIVSDQISEAEKIRLRTAPWPIAGQYDVFQVSHRALPTQPLRRVVAQSWNLPLFGGDMDWSTNVVASL